jgi:hypothetical protein
LIHVRKLWTYDYWGIQNSLDHSGFHPCTTFPFYDLAFFLNVCLFSVYHYIFISLNLFYQSICQMYFYTHADYPCKPLGINNALTFY